MRKVWEHHHHQLENEGIMKAIIGLAAVLALLFAVPVFADLHNPANRADYLIITTDSLLRHTSWISDLAAWRNAHGRTAMAVATDSIWHEFGNGAPSDTVLKDFLIYAYDEWQEPRLRDVFIIGWHDVVPSHVIHDTVTGYEQTYLSDCYFTLDPDSILPIPDFSIGRLPWSPASLAPLWNYAAKIIAYESGQADTWQSRIHLIADSSTIVLPWQNTAESIAGIVPSGYAIERDYLDLPPENPWHGDRNEIFANWNLGSYLVAFCGYGSANIWTHGLNLSATFFDSLTNGSQLPIVIHLSNSLNIGSNFTVGGIVQSLLSNPNGGAIADLGRSNIPWVTSGIGFNRSLATYAVRDSINTLGDLWRMAELQYAHDNAFSFGRVSPASQTLFGAMLFGDPGLRLPPRPSFAEERAPLLPQELRLIGNYPNPFNATTRLAFDLNRDARVSLKVLDILGRETATLVDGFTSAGRHNVAWNAGNIPTGVYFAVLTAGDVRRVSKMLLLK
jgi:hypothetical protein